ncbi:CACTA en-spm transposon protein [Cucumis melo var. makuwa]|uniref:CACTA en-spm transposon protein n=1 Tax=Cucumis melo var. makuwa TaxID=1194695 RepID=A0A5D3E2J7_CUCMM|nr:CACTA en-spm transposon protein [Cucumis melo var. makuwa]TYK30297.1 CACTA en-spm transposon protein [Cucumis melo var. makuwa]
MNESSTFCSCYLSGIAAQFTTDVRNDELISEFEIFKQKDVPEVDDVENEQLNVLEIIVGHRVDDHIEDDTLCTIDVDPTIVERLIVRHVANDFIDVGDEQLSHQSGTSTISSFSSSFDEIDAIFFEFVENLNNPTRGSSSVGENSSTTQPSSTTTSKRRAQSRLLELERYIHANERISMSIAPGTKKSISPHAIRFSQAICMCIRKTFPVCCLRWANVGREYIEVVKGDLHHFFVLDFNDQVMNRLVEHQMLNTFKKFMGDCHKQFKSTTTL